MRLGGGLLARSEPAEDLRKMSGERANGDLPKIDGEARWALSPSEVRDRKPSKRIRGRTYCRMAPKAPIA
jgi:hypothetical protein